MIRLLKFGVMETRACRECWKTQRPQNPMNNHKQKHGILLSLFHKCCQIFEVFLGKFENKNRVMSGKIHEASCVCVVEYCGWMISILGAQGLEGVEPQQKCLLTFTH